MKFEDGYRREEQSGWKKTYFITIGSLFTSGHDLATMN